MRDFTVIASGPGEFASMVVFHVKAAHFQHAIERVRKSDKVEVIHLCFAGFKVNLMGTAEEVVL